MNSSKFDPDKRNPYYECPDDTVCYYCGADLPKNPERGTYPDFGFCDKQCCEGQQKIADSFDE